MARLIDRPAEHQDRSIAPSPAAPRCEHCGRPHGHTLRCLPDGRWLSPDGLWFSDEGDPAPWPDVVEYAGVRTSRSIVGLYRRRAEKAMERQWLCRRCHMVTARDEHRRVTRTRSLMRLALGDLFEGTYTI
ncbi:hypothetical protein GBZ26_20530 [Azospirillum formosense]|uniref:Uncharacterized protein n=1 Tax=Azospirillum formosense TaxID=861533 RepID=A0ABX2KY15_9PROT|nr:hypothetical protein [Azospirillum formosense]MBY3756589.1 hypothetical protein [Azospirillum formosense]NUB21563.1 hypothetical protein [Azospirillum formosense]